MTDRYILISVKEANEKGYPDAPDCWDPYNTCLYETDGEKPVRLVHVDGGEPEDQTFYRDWNWIVAELNKLAEGV